MTPTDAPDVDLPPLPEPPSYESRYDDAPLTDHYSQKQMKAYALQAVLRERERCARIVDDCYALESVAAAMRGKKAE